MEVRERTTTSEQNGTATSGRKGIPYDWQSLLAAAQADALELELASITPEYAE